MGKPQVSDDDSLLSKVGDCKACFLCVLAILEYDLNFLHDGSILIWSSIYIVNWYWVWQGASLQLVRSEEHTSELQSHSDLVCRLLLEKKKKNNVYDYF